ncbi:MAG TPA: PKD domain-containing protein [Bacteroidia bacterium]|nr:PKD domain-containing protein [Bacteroidia bacterium]
MKTKTTLSSAGIKKIFFIFFMLVTAAYGKAQDSCQTTKALFTVEKTTADCQHYSITNLSTGNNLTYHWSFSDGVQSTSANPGTHVFTEIGEHYLFLFIKDTLTNCTSFFSDTLECPCQAIFNSADLPNHIRTTQFLVYTDSIQKAFSWSFGDGSTSTLVNPIHQYPHEGTFTACLTVRSLTDTSCVDTQCKDVIVKDSTITSNCHAVFTTKTDSLDTHKILITNLSTGNNLSYICRRKVACGRKKNKGCRHRKSKYRFRPVYTF